MLEEVKIQDIIFFAVMVFLLYKRDSRLFVVVGIVSLIISIPLFYFWIFFTAERLTWYAGAFFTLSIVFQLFENKKKSKKR